MTLSPTRRNSGTDSHASTPTEGTSKRVVAVKRRDSMLGSNSKFSGEFNRVTFTKLRSDSELQGTNNRRRYKRRGSKCPSMLMMISAQNVFPRDPSCFDHDNMFHSETHKHHQHAHQQQQQQQQKQRRMSLMSALKASMERASLVDKCSDEERRNSTFELLSQVDTC